MQRRIRFWGSTWIAGAVLAGLGMFFLYKDLADAAARLTQVATANGSRSLGILTAAMLSTGAAGHGGLPAFLQHLLLSSWPLVLVVLGTGAVADLIAPGRDAIGKKRVCTCRSKAGSFDVQVEVI